jgi:hypothetical protein
MQERLKAQLKEFYSDGIGKFANWWTTCIEKQGAYIGR